MKIIQTILLIIFLYGCGSSQPNEQAPSNPIIKQLKILLPEKEYKVDIIDGIKMEPRYEELYSKFIASIQANSEWFLKQQKIKEDTGLPIPYHPNLGLSEIEYDEMKLLIEKGPGMEMIKSGEANVKIIHDANEIRFIADENLPMLNDIKIDLNDNTVWFGDIHLNSFQPIEVKNSNNGLKSAWNGFQWIFEESNRSASGIDGFPSSEELKTLNMRQYKLVVGQLAKDSSTYIDISAREVEKGEQLFAAKIPFKFKT